MTAAADRLTLSIPSNPYYLGTLREFLRALLQTAGFRGTEVDGVVLAVHEACTNVIKHCYQGDTTQRLDLTVLLTADTVTIDLQDYGTRQDTTTIKPRALHEVRPGGLGTHFMQAIMDEVTYSSSDTGTMVRMIKRRSVSCTSL